MTRHWYGAIAGARTALVLSLLWCGLWPGAVRGQVEVRPTEREAELAQVEIEEVPLDRHLLAAQELAVWLPEGWHVVPSLATTDGASFASAGGEVLLTVSSRPVPPGAGLLPLLDQVLSDLANADVDSDVESVRRVRIAGRDAFEVAYTATRGDDEQTGRLLLSMDPDQAHYRLLILRGPDTPDAPLDVTYKRSIRDWSPLDDGVWSLSLERLRDAATRDLPPTAWSERNRLFDAMARPEAIGQPWFQTQLRQLAREDPGLLIDGLLHHHPRVRIGCIEALDPAFLEEPTKSELFAAVMTDPDPAVRFRAARSIAGDDATAAAVLEHLLETDSESARAGAFQLLAVAGEESRAERVAGAFANRRQYPETSQPFLAAVLASWGAPEQAAPQLRAAWKTTRVESLERAAWLELLGLGDREALEAAFLRMAQPRQPSLLPLRAAATGMAAHAEAGDLERLQGLVAALEPAEEGEDKEDEEDEEIAAARGVLEALISHLESLPESPSAEAECEALGGGASWAASRRRALGCPEERPAALVRGSLSRPGAYALALQDLLDRLEVGSAVHNQAFHSLVDRLHRRLDDWAGDPITAAATGVDLDAPWQIQRWGTPGLGGETTGAGDRRGVALRLVSTDSARADPARLLDTILRASSGPFDLKAAAKGVLLASSLPLMPLGVVATWDDERELVSGTDAGGSTPAPTETHVALGAAEARGEGKGEDRPLYALALGTEGAEWHVTHVVRQGTEVVLSESAEPPAATTGPGSPSAAPAAPASWSRLEVDLGRLLDREAPEGLLERTTGTAGGDLSFSAATTIEADVLATAFRLDGLSDVWLSLAQSLSPAVLRAPQELLPEGCQTWVGFGLSAPRVAGWLRDDPPEVFAGLPRRRRARILALLAELGGEAGVAVVGVPEPQGADAGEAWKRHTVAYLAVEPKAADRFLGKLARHHQERAGRRVYELGDTFLARVGGFVVAASNPEILATLGRPPFLAASSLYRQVESRAPADALLWAGWDTDRLAEVVEESIAQRSEAEGSTLVLEIFRSFGSLAAWVRRSDSALIGEVAAHPRLQSEATDALMRRLTGYGDLIRGSVSARGLPSVATDELSQDVVELTLHLPEDLPDIDLQWANERLDQERVAPGTYRFVSRRATALPESSDVRLPIRDPELLPFKRDERNLDLHSKEIRDLAETIRGDERDPARIVRAIVEWAHDKLEYSLVDGDVSTEQILATRQADCTEYSQLTIALARSLGIPARPVQGAYVGIDAAYFHRWAEVFLDRWYEVDPTWGVVEIPATNLRIPPDDVVFLAALPGVRFTVETVASTDGGFARRLPGVTGQAGEEPPDLAVDAARVLVASPAAAEGTTLPLPTVPLLYSVDAGRTFAEVRRPPARDAPCASSAVMDGSSGSISRRARPAGWRPGSWTTAAAGGRVACLRPCAARRNGRSAFPRTATWLSPPTRRGSSCSIGISRSKPTSPFPATVPESGRWRGRGGCWRDRSPAKGSRSSVGRAMTGPIPRRSSTPPTSP